MRSTNRRFVKPIAITMPKTTMKMPPNTGSGILTRKAPILVKHPIRRLRTPAHCITCTHTHTFERQKLNHFFKHLFAESDTLCASAVRWVVGHTLVEASATENFRTTRTPKLTRRLATLVIPIAAMFSLYEVVPVVVPTRPASMHPRPSIMIPL